MNVLAGGSLTSVPGVEVGHWTDSEAATGCTVIALPEGAVVAGEVRGAAPGTRETALLAPGMTVERADAIVLAGGSAFGLAAADGVMGVLESRGRGHPTPTGPVPIIPSAVIYDLAVGDSSTRPTAENGVEALRAATSAPVPQGRVGAGAGATVSKWRGRALPSGLGSAAVEVGAATVAALVVLNAMGDVFSLAGDPLTGGPHAPGPIGGPARAGESTTLAVVAVDADVGRAELTRLAVRAQDAFAACIRPVHTRFDGDTVFAVSCGESRAPTDDLAEGAFHATGLAVERAARSARDGP